jgi:hypothetical protein
MYPTSRAASFVAEKSGLNIGLIYVEQAPYLVWKEILDLAAKSGKSRDVVQLVHDQNPGNPKLPLLDALLDEKPPICERQPRAPDGSPLFLKDSDNVTEPEALLFHDDLTLQIGRVPWLVKVLRRLLELAPSVCRLEVVVPGAIELGTGFRIGQDLLLTNWHVLFPTGLQGTAITASFGYEDDEQGVGLAGSTVACDAASIVANKKDDWGVVRVSQALSADIPIVSLAAAVAPTLQRPAFIIQHPGGARKRVAYVRNQVTFFDDRVVHYLSDTQLGSSGAPVLDENGTLIALHHAGGRPQEVAGKPPLKKNEGIRISRVLDGLQAAGITL